MQRREEGAKPMHQGSTHQVPAPPEHGGSRRPPAQHSPCQLSVPGSRVSGGLQPRVAARALRGSGEGSPEPRDERWALEEPEPPLL